LLGECKSSRSYVTTSIPQRSYFRLVHHTSHSRQVFHCSRLPNITDTSLSSLLLSIKNSTYEKKSLFNKARDLRAFTYVCFGSSALHFALSRSTSVHIYRSVADILDKRQSVGRRELLMFLRRLSIRFGKRVSRRRENRRCMSAVVPL
jgi:hypothetical protein